MSPSDPLPVVHHFYPINPQTALQQQSAVYNSPNRPLVAPILPASSQSFRDAPTSSNKKRKIEGDPEIDYLGTLPGSLSQTADPNYRQVKLLQEPVTVCLGPRQQRRIPYIELPDHRSINLTLYRPISLASPASQLLLGWGRHDPRARAVSQTSFGESVFSSSSSEPSTVSEYLCSENSLHIEERQKGARGKKGESHSQAKDFEVIEEDEASTCHQCRRKTTKQKMRCRRLRPDGTVCPFLFCQNCIDVRYDENFHPSHPSWHCPRCRGICNCSICLRKAGFGYILDGSMSEEFTGTKGRLSMPSQGKKRSLCGGVKKGHQHDAEKPRISVRAWLARKGIALGTEEWMVERRRQGVRYVVGKSPPPFDVPSPYMEAQFNQTIAACTEYIGEEDDINDPSDEKPLCEGDADTAMSSGSLTLNHSDATVISNTQEMNSNRELQPTDLQLDSSALFGVTAADTREATGSHLLPSSLPDANPPLLPVSNEDLPGLSSAVTHGTRLIIGKPLPKSKRKRKQLKPSKLKKPKAIKPNTQVDADVSDYDYDTPQIKVGLPSILAGGCNLTDSGMQIKTNQDHEKEEGKHIVGGLSPLSDVFCSPRRTDAISTPPPAEPVLVPTDYYAPSKLDGRIAKHSPSHFGHTYWSFNAVTPYDQGHDEHNGGGHGSSSLLMSTPLYSNSDQHPYPQFSMDDVSPVRPSATESTSASMSRDGAHPSSESTSLSNSRTPDDYLNSQVHTHPRDVDGYTPHGLAAFSTLDEWPPVDMEPYSNLEIDMSPLQVEGITRSVDFALLKHQSDQP